jgi:hypothetical protein
MSCRGNVAWCGRIATASITSSRAWSRDRPFVSPCQSTPPRTSIIASWRVSGRLETGALIRTAVGLRDFSRSNSVTFVRGLSTLDCPAPRLTRLERRRHTFARFTRRNKSMCNHANTKRSILIAGFTQVGANRGGIRQFVSYKKLCLIAVSAITASVAVHPASAQVAEAAIAAVAVEAIKSMVSDVNENDNQLRENFARYYIDDAQKKYPDYNVVLIHTQHTLSGEYTHDHVEVPISLGRTIGYEIYFAGRGRPFTLTNQGDGGFINWMYSGDFTRDGSTIRAN